MYTQVWELPLDSVGKRAEEQKGKTGLLKYTWRLIVGCVWSLNESLFQMVLESLGNCLFSIIEPVYIALVFLSPALSFSFFYTSH